MKQESSGLGFMLFILFVLLGASIYFFYINIPSKPQNLVPVSSVGNTSSQQALTRSKQFYPNTRFPDKAISYKFDDSCDDNKKRNVVESFDILKEQSVLEFYPASNIEDAQLNILCSGSAPEPSTRDHYVAGEGGPTEVLNTSLFAVIKKAQISLYRDERCSTPHIALHELLHALGFDHNNNPESILYPTLDCSQQVDSYIYSDINQLYSAPTLADLAISNVNATKTGRYLGFSIEVSNSGLKDANPVSLDVYADNNFVKEFDLQDIDIGTRKILSVENLRISSGAQKIEFIVDEKNKIAEIYEDNNMVELALV